MAPCVLTSTDLDWQRHFNIRTNVCSKVSELLLGTLSHAGAIFRATEDTTQIVEGAEARTLVCQHLLGQGFPQALLCLRHRCVRPDSPSSSSSQRAATSRPSCRRHDFVVRCFALERPAVASLLAGTRHVEHVIDSRRPDHALQVQDQRQIKDFPSELVFLGNLARPPSTIATVFEAAG